MLFIYVVGTRAPVSVKWIFLNTALSPPFRLKNGPPPIRIVSNTVNSSNSLLSANECLLCANISTEPVFTFVYCSGVGEQWASRITMTRVSIRNTRFCIKSLHCLTICFFVANFVNSPSKMFKCPSSNGSFTVSSKNKILPKLIYTI